MERGEHHGVHTAQIVVEKKILSVSSSSVIISVVFGIIALAGLAYLVWYFGMTKEKAAIVILIGTLIYAISLFLILKQKHIREVKNIPVPVKVIEKPGEVRTQIIKQRMPLFRKVIKPVYIEKINKQKPRVKVKKVYVNKKVKRAKPIYHKFVASSTTKIYHTARSRLARLIKNKNKVYFDSEVKLKKQGYKPSVHIQREKKEDAEKLARKLGRGKRKTAKQKPTPKKKLIKKTSKKKESPKAKYKIGDIR